MITNLFHRLITIIQSLAYPNFSKMDLRELMSEWGWSKNNIRRKNLISDILFKNIKKSSCWDLIYSSGYVPDELKEIFDQELKKKLAKNETGALDLVILKAYRNDYTEILKKFPGSFQIIDNLYIEMLPAILKETNDVEAIVSHGKYEAVHERLKNVLTNILPEVSDLKEIVALYWTLNPSFPDLAYQTRNRLIKELGGNKDELSNYLIEALHSEPLYSAVDFSTDKDYNRYLRARGRRLSRV